MLERYRSIPTYAAVAVATMISVCTAAALGAGGAFVAGFLLDKYSGPGGMGMGGGVLVILVILNVAQTAFIGTFTAIINCHHRTSWKTPTFAFVLCVLLDRIMGPFSIRFAPFMLTTGAATWLISSWLLHKKGSSDPQHVV